jgi:hypothetical protein
VYETYWGNMDMSDLIDWAILRFGLNGKVGAEGSEGCDHRNEGGGPSKVYSAVFSAYCYVWR